MRPPRLEKNPYISLKVANMMNKLVARGYITEEVILALTSFFSVPKGTDYIHMVFDATVIVLNNSLWSAKFMLPSMVSLFMMVGMETHMVNLDVVGMFYNFQLSSVLDKYCGVDWGYYMVHMKDSQ